jgi:hypothetical protein
VAEQEEGRGVREKECMIMEQEAKQPKTELARLGEFLLRLEAAWTGGGRYDRSFPGNCSAFRQSPHPT